MNISFDENLSDELTNENASSISVKVCPGLNKNMSNNPFEVKRGYKAQSQNESVCMEKVQNSQLNNMLKVDSRKSRKPMKSLA